MYNGNNVILTRVFSPVHNEPYSTCVLDGAECKQTGQKVTKQPSAGSRGGTAQAEPVRTHAEEH